ncbi:MAG: hypothetical protein RR998_09025 [Oscillospiraceae bacterium]
MGDDININMACEQFALALQDARSAAFSLRESWQGEAANSFFDQLIKLDKMKLNPLIMRLAKRVGRRGNGK